MGKWEMVRLGDVFKIASGGTPAKNRLDYYNKGTIPWVKTGDLKEKYVNSEYVERITDLGLANSSAKLFPSDTVLIAMYGATIGATSILNFEACTNQACAAFLPSKSIQSEFLYYFLLSQKANFIKLGVGGAQPNISATILKEVKMPLPPLDEQKRIAKNLDLASEIVKGYKEQFAELDKLVQSIFYEMFDDPVTNEKGWETKYIDELYEIIDGDRGTNYPKQEEFSDEGYCLFLNAGNVTKKGFVFENVQFITRGKDKLLRKGKLQRDDIVLTTRGTVGNLAHYTENIPFDNVRINSGMVILRRFTEIEHNYFLTYFSNPLIYTSLMSGSAQPQLPITNMRKAKVLYPPLPLQTRFASIVTEIETQKAQIQEALTEAENLFKSLMQEYFE